MNKRFALWICSLLWLSLATAQTNPLINRVDPPFWWVGMHNPELQLLVYGEGIAGSGVVINYPGVELRSVTRVENPNYLFLDLYISPEAEPGSVPIQFVTTQRQTVVAYDLLKREVKENSIQGLDAGDFIYLLMPDRFANGDPGNDNIEGMQEPIADREKLYHRHGGDIQGIIDHLDYLQDLGVTAVWPNPLWENDQPHESYHGYAITDHYRIDPRHGSNELFLELIDQCHQRGMKFIGDVVYNHVGDQHWFIKDMPSRDWVNQWPEFTKSNFRAPTLLDPYGSDQDHKIMAKGWFDTHMPDLNQKNPFLARYLIQNSIWWIEYSGLDAYRIDTYAYPDQKFMADWAEAIMSEYPGFTFFGETWVHGTGVQSWFTTGIQNKGFDSHMRGVTDFQMQYAINDALTREFGWTDGVSKIYYTLAQDYIYADPMSNVIFLDNHDVTRFFTYVKEDIRKYKMGVALLLTLRGIPQLYYGTEILMPDSEIREEHDKWREEFSGGWPGDKKNKFTARGRNKQENEAFNYLRTLARYRLESSALRFGQLMQFVPENGHYVFFRYDANQTVMVLVNQNEEDTQVETSRFSERMNGFTTARDVVTGKSIEDLSNINLPGQTVRVLELGN